MQKRVKYRCASDASGSPQDAERGRGLQAGQRGAATAASAQEKNSLLRNTFLNN